MPHAMCPIVHHFISEMPFTGATNKLTQLWISQRHVVTGKWKRTRKIPYTLMTLAMILTNLPEVNIRKQRKSKLNGSKQNDRAS